MGARKMVLLRPRHVQQFITNESTQHCRITMIEHCSILRDFLAFLYQAGSTSINLSAAVVSPKTYRHERSPRFLSRDEIQAVLRSVDRNTPIGRRDYAMLLLLSTYGLRGIEVVRMKLEDLDWRTEKLSLRHRKGRHASVYPLTGTVAEALVAYLKKGRPTTTHREIFLTDVAPFRPMQTVAVRHVLKKHLRAAGLESRGAGAHTLRYSCAQRLFDDDFSVKVIGDYLGHRNLDTTLRYIKIDFKSLREVALNNGEEML
jgi:site-specific recombinase XerD